VNSVHADVELDLRGLYCPEPIFRTKDALDKMKKDQVLKVVADDPAAEEDLKRWSKRTGNRLLKMNARGQELIAYIKKVA